MTPVQQWCQQQQIKGTRPCFMQDITQWTVFNTLFNDGIYMYILALNSFIISYAKPLHQWNCTYDHVVSAKRDAV